MKEVSSGIMKALFRCQELNQPNQVPSPEPRSTSESHWLHRHRRRYVRVWCMISTSPPRSGLVCDTRTLVCVQFKKPVVFMFGVLPASENNTSPSPVHFLPYYSNQDQPPKKKKAKENTHPHTHPHTHWHSLFSHNQQRNQTTKQLSTTQPNTWTKSMCKIWLLLLLDRYFFSIQS